MNALLGSLFKKIILYLYINIIIHEIVFIVKLQDDELLNVLNYLGLKLLMLSADECILTGDLLKFCRLAKLPLLNVLKLAP